MIRILLFSILLTGLTSCTSIQSIKNPDQESSHALRYFMPKKDFKVEVTVENQEISNVVLGTTVAYPDLSTSYALKYNQNLLGTNNLDIVLGENSLLTFVSSQTQSNIAATLQNLAVPMDGKERTPDSDSISKSYSDDSLSEHGCGTDRTYTFIHKKAGKYNACGLTITIKKYGDNSRNTSHRVKENNAVSGVFYRQNLPYLMTAKGNNIQTAAIVFSPSESKTQFIPISKTLFANNNAILDFKDGVLTRYTQHTNGEISALLTLPAEIIKAYFGAAGSIFPRIGDQNPQQVTDPYSRAYQEPLPSSSR